MKSARMRKKKKSKNPRFKFLFSQAYKVLFEFIEVLEFFLAKKKNKDGRFSYQIYMDTVAILFNANEKV